MVRESKRTGLLIPSLFFFGLAAMVIIVGLRGVSLGQQEIYLLQLLLFAVLGFSLARFWSVSGRAGNVDLFELPTWFTINVFLFLGVSGRLAANDPTLLVARLEGNTYWLNVALFYVILGTVSMWLGYRLDLFGKLGTVAREAGGSLRRSVADGLSTSPQLVMGFVLAFYGLSVASRLLKLGFGVYAYLQTEGSYQVWVRFLQVFSYAENLGLLATLALALHIFGNEHTKSEPFPRMLLYAMVFLEVFFVYVGGVKGPIVNLMVLLFAVTRYRQAKIPWGVAAILLVLFVLVFPVNREYRTLIRVNAFDRTSLTQAVQTISDLFLQTWFGRPLGENLAVMWETLTGRQSSLIQNIAVIIRLTPSYIPFLGGRYYWLLPLNILVPRVIWPSKPVVHLGAMITHLYLGKDIQSSSAVTPFGDLYMNFGLPGILIGMLLLGSLYRVIYGWLRRNLSEPNLALYLAILFYATNYEADIPGLVQGLVQRFALFYLAVRLMYRSAASTVPGAPSERPSSKVVCTAWGE